jgi:DNA-binding FadR family transcriptional regulator
MSASVATTTQSSLVGQAISRVRAYIRDNKLKVGDNLPGEGKFAADLGVSRPVMREAFGALAALRQIDVGNGRRARVAAIDGAVIASSIDHGVATAQISLPDVWEVRRTLELRTVELAAKNRCEADAEAIVRSAEAMAAAQGDLARLAKADIELHQGIARARGNPLFVQNVRSFEQLMESAVPQAWQTRQTQDQRNEMIALHAEIAWSIARGNVTAALIAMDRHFDASIGEMIRNATATRMA